MPKLSRPDSVSVWGPDREWWVFQPGPRLGICLDEGVYDFVFHQKTYQFKRNMAISPAKHLTMLGQNFPWRAMLIDYHEGLALQYTAERGWSHPAGVFPMWSAQNDTDSLMRLLRRYPLDGEPVGVFTGSNVMANAVRDQERRILICNFPRFKDQWESVFRDLMEAKREYPDVIFHLNGQKSVPRTLGTGVDSFDHPITIDWQGDQPRLLLANGSLLDFGQHQKTTDHRAWAKLVGMDAGDIFRIVDRTVKSRRMYTFNLRSLKWAFSNYDQAWSMRVVDESEYDLDDPDSSWVPVDLKFRPRSSDAGDKWVCDLCSIRARCPFSRPGAVCMVPDTPAASLAGKFQTRNSNDILDALGTVLAAQTDRAERAIKAEQEANDRDGAEPRFSPEVTKMLATLFDQGVTLARLVDPRLGAGAKGQKVINASIAREDLGGATPQQLAANFARELDEMGYNLDDLTPEQAEEALRRLVPSGTLPAHVDDDNSSATAQALGAGGNPVAQGPPPLRATPRLDP